MTKYRVYYRVTLACEADFEMDDLIYTDEPFDAGDMVAWNHIYKIPDMVEFWGFDVDKVEEVEED